jgi:hypothetical protein
VATVQAPRGDKAARQPLGRGDERRSGAQLPVTADANDPVCAFHGKRRSEHRCLVCSLCFKDLTPGECSYQPDGSQVDVRVPCAEHEQAMLIKIAQQRNGPST